MRTPFTALALALAVGLTTLSLSACNQAAPVPPALQVGQVQADAAARPDSVADTSVPAASTVFAPGAQTAPAEVAASGRPNAPLSAAQEANAMPMPGQNNDHSAPLAAAKPASAAPAAAPRP